MPVVEDDSAKKPDIGTGVALLTIAFKGPKDEICVGGVDAKLADGFVNGSLDCYDKNMNLVSSQHPSAN